MVEEKNNRFNIALLIVLSVNAMLVVIQWFKPVPIHFGLSVLSFAITHGFLILLIYIYKLSSKEILNIELTCRFISIPVNLIAVLFYVINTYTGYVDAFSSIGIALIIMLFSSGMYAFVINPVALLGFFLIDSFSVFISQMVFVMPNVEIGYAGHFLEIPVLAIINLIMYLFITKFNETEEKMLVLQREHDEIKRREQAEEMLEHALNEIEALSDFANEVKENMRFVLTQLKGKNIGVSSGFVHNTPRLNEDETQWLFSIENDKKHRTEVFLDCLLVEKTESITRLDNLTVIGPLQSRKKRNMDVPYVQAVIVIKDNKVITKFDLVQLETMQVTM